VAYYASAEMGCFLQLGWELPTYVLDLYVEFARRVSGRDDFRVPGAKGLLGALRAHGLKAMEAEDKEAFRELAMRGGSYTREERQSLIEYCQTDVDQTASLLEKMAPRIDLPRAILRGWYMKAVAKMERTGIPCDVGTLGRLRSNWETIKGSLIAKVDEQYGVYDGTTFKMDRFKGYLRRVGIAWPKTKTGRLSLSEDTFKDMAKSYPKQIGPLRELRNTMGQMRLNTLTVGPDGRNRCLLSPFGSKTGRNQPSNAKFLFGPSAWFRSLIKPAEGRAVAYVDWSQQEFGTAAALSGDEDMMEAYRSGDPYLAFAKQAGAAPADATKESHKEVRDQFKVTALAVQYGMQEESLALKLGVNTSVARGLLRMHRMTYPRYWHWTQEITDKAAITSTVSTVFGWTVHVGMDSRPTSIVNFPCQANGAEMMRVACIMLTEAGIEVCAPVHDALLIEADDDKIEDAVATTQRIMEEASAIVLDGFRLRSDAKIVRWPNRYVDERGEQMWGVVMGILDGVESAPEPVLSMPDILV
jgi:DNA polymerase I-like protein with 3'-5' exonuclease and polymerase domains